MSREMDEGNKINGKLKDVENGNNFYLNGH